MVVPPHNQNVHGLFVRTARDRHLTLLRKKRANERERETERAERERTLTALNDDDDDSLI